LTASSNPKKTFNLTIYPTHMSNNLKNIKKDLLTLNDPVKAEISSKFFKTGKGQYGEGDIFLGIKVPEQRKVSKKYTGLTLDDISHLLKSEIHEYRLTALFILVLKYKKEDTNGKQEIVDFYLSNTENINNWDLVDSSAHYILGDFLLDKDRSILYKLARSENLWERRIAMLSTFAFIKKEQFEDALNISEILLFDEHDLIHKAVGWMLREIGKRDLKIEDEFLQKRYNEMPRTMLRYAIEKFDEEKRNFYLSKTKEYTLASKAG
jgi:3-methyladenine DNA glycosylase AlkD